MRVGRRGRRRHRRVPGPSARAAGRTASCSRAGSRRFDAAQPFHDVVALAAGERLPQVFGHEREREPDGSHLHHALIDVVGARPPVLAALGIGAVREPLDPPVPVVERAAARDQRHDAPERARVPLELRDALARSARRTCRAGPGRHRGRGGGRSARRDRPLPVARRLSWRAGCRPSGWPRRPAAGPSRDPIQFVGPHLVLERVAGDEAPRSPPPPGRPCARARCRVNPRCAGSAPRSAGRTAGSR